mgnify:CR=1 FL=1
MSYDIHSQKFYKVKNPKKKFLCALCSAPREMRYSKNLSFKNYLQIIVLSLFLAWCFSPLMGEKSLYLFFIVWLSVELANKLLYRKEIPCPYCGFDATWYRRDVKVANKMVKNFWKNQNRSSQVNEDNESEMVSLESAKEQEKMSQTEEAMQQGAQI